MNMKNIKALFNHPVEVVEAALELVAVTLGNGPITRDARAFRVWAIYPWRVFVSVDDTLTAYREKAGVPNYADVEVTFSIEEWKRALLTAKDAKVSRETDDATLRAQIATLIAANGKLAEKNEALAARILLYELAQDAVSFRND